MGGVAAMVTCALCGTKMTADTQYCPKCGSLNAHYSYSKSPIATLDARELAETSATAETAAPAVPEVAPPTDVPHHTRRVPAHQQEQMQVDASQSAIEVAGQPALQYGPPPSVGAQEQNMPGMTAAPEWQNRPDIDLDAGGPAASYYSVVRVPVRALPQAPDEVEARARRAFALEMFGYVGVLGLGHMYGGRVGRGLVLMASWLMALAVLIPPLVRSISLVSCTAFVMLLSVGPIVSGYLIQKELRQEIGRGRR